MRPHRGVEEAHTIETLEGHLYCPSCATPFTAGGYSSAFWRADEIVYFCWCNVCNWLGDIVEMRVVTSFEREQFE